jgi:hypothetical protein
VVSSRVNFTFTFTFIERARRATLREDFQTCYILSYHYCLGIAKNTGITFAVKVEFSFRWHIKTDCWTHLTSCSVGVLESFHASNETKARSWPLNSHLVRGYECMEFASIQPPCLYDAAFGQINNFAFHRQFTPWSRILLEKLTFPQWNNEVFFLRKLKKHYRIQVISLMVPICRYPVHSFVAC